MKAGVPARPERAGEDPGEVGALSSGRPHAASPSPPSGGEEGPAHRRRLAAGGPRGRRGGRVRTRRTLIFGAGLRCAEGSLLPVPGRRRRATALPVGRARPGPLSPPSPDPHQGGRGLSRLFPPFPHRQPADPANKAPFPTPLCPPAFSQAHNGLRPEPDHAPRPRPDRRNRRTAVIFSARPFPALAPARGRGAPRPAKRAPPNPPLPAPRALPRLAPP